jgi:outer membrane receptor protein involved in Fe transport
MVEPIVNLAGLKRRAISIHWRKAALGMWGLVLGAAGWSDPAWTQQQTAPGVNGAGAAASSVLEEITVTAEKRESTVQKTPISMTALSGQELESRGISDLLSAVQQTPGISYKTAGPGQTEFEMRGLPSSGGFSPTVGFYVDDVPLTAPAQAFQGKVVIDPDLYDINRVEMLRGPQGTLYGAGSMGGTIKLVTNHPVLNEFQSSVETIGSDTNAAGGNFAGNFMLNIPLSQDVAALRVVGTYKWNAGWIDRVVLDPFPLETGTGARGNVLAAPVQNVVADVNWERLEGARAVLLLQLGDRLKVTPTIMYQKIDQGGANTIDNPPGNQLAHYQPFNVTEPFSDRFTLFTGTLSYDFDAAQLTSVSSRWYRSESQDQDISESLQILFGFPGFSVADGGVGGGPITETDSSSQFSQELRLASTGQAAFQWLIGGFYSKFNSSSNFYSVYPGFTPQFGTDILSIIEQPISITQKAVFGEASYAITPQLKATAGLRWYTYNSTETTTESGIATAASGPGIYTASSRASNSGSNPKLNLSYSFSDDLLLYATAAKGFRPGAGNQPIPLSGPLQCVTGPGNLQSLGIAAEPNQFDPDTLWSYELGEKARLLDRRFELNGAIYYEDWTKVQQQVSLACGFSFTANAGTAGIYGGELEAAAILSPHLTLTQNLGYTHATYTQAVQATDTVAGQQILNIPKVTASTGVVYTIPLSVQYTFVARATNSYFGPIQDITFTRNSLPGYDLVNARLGVDTGKWSAFLFVDNLTDRLALLSDFNALSANVPQFNRVAVNQPRTIGIDLHFQF